eukprot:CAMPEP_0182442576 /NCGR_PEP_ID=MMETSP1172-20130603/1485_1 /TAXON_ID=708627 /ORGANISM="Timspurckia oligopyrenoides, Strain CCMP3278" /LENGTH=448 /DNA_ID=CAMNT_0024637515 /DNA_START=85 /DNA_END=1431 /DNA_ORIENTATION=+
MAFESSKRHCILSLTCVLIAVTLGFNGVQGRGPVLGAFVIHRHGARSHLVKNADDLGSESHAVLLAAGVEQMNALGQKLRKMYISGEDSNGDYKITGIGNQYSGASFRIESSHLQRTLASATATSSGLYPNEVVPLYADSYANHRIRAYAACPMINDLQEEFFESDEFATKKDETEAFRNSFLQAGYTDNAALEDWFNVYDRFLLREFYPGSQVTDIPILNESMSAQVEELAFWVESRKFSKNYSKILGGSPLLKDIVSIMKELKQGKKTPPLRVYSAHYPTILSLLAAMGFEYEEGTITSRIPTFGSSLLINLHATENGSKMQVSIDTLEREESGLVYTLTEVKTYDSFGQFLESVSAASGYEIGSWCQQCKTKSTEQGDLDEICTGDFSNSSSSEMSPVLAGFIGALVTFVVCALVFGWFIYSKRKRFQTQSYATDNYASKEFNDY